LFAFNCGLPKIKKTSNRTNANIKIHFGLNDKVPFFNGLTHVQDNNFFNKINHENATISIMCIIRLSYQQANNVPNLSYQQCKSAFTYSDSNTITVSQLSIRRDPRKPDINVDKLLHRTAKFCWIKNCNNILICYL